MELNLETAKKFTDIVINNFEGGYYHPDLKQYLKGGEKMGISGETMFGIDFAHGGSLGTSQFAQEVHNYFAPYVSAVNDNASAWAIYNDKADGKKVAPKEYGQRWRPMVAQMMLDLFKQYFTQLNTGAQQIILKDPALFLQFWYAVWNGPGAFQKFAEVMNRAYAEGTRDPQTLNIIIQDVRYATRPRQSSERMDAITSEMYGRPNYPDTPATTQTRRVWPLVIFGALATILIVKSLK